MKKIAFIINPVAGGGRTKKLAPLASRKLREAGCEIKEFWSTRPGESINLASKAILEGFEVLVACGGDGTVLEVASGLLRSPTKEVALGIMPWGRGNDVSKDLGIPQELETSIDLLLDGQPKEIDAIVSGERAFLGVGGIGLDAQVAVNGNKWRRFLRSDFLAYEVGAIVTILYYPHFSVEVTIDGCTQRYDKTYLISVGNTSTYSRGMKILPRASFQDGKLDVCVVTAQTRFHLLRIFPSVFSGNHLQDEGISYFQADSVQIRTLNGERIYYFADGEILGQLPAKFSILSKKIKVFLPKE